jgi:hypothetical protein
MGSKPPRTFLDFEGLDADAGVRCGGCTRTLTIDARELASHFGALGLVEPVVKLAARLKCRSCGHRGARIIPVPRKA